MNDYHNINNHRSFASFSSWSYRELQLQSCFLSRNVTTTPIYFFSLTSVQFVWVDFFVQYTDSTAPSGAFFIYPNSSIIFRLMKNEREMKALILILWTKSTHVDRCYDFNATSYSILYNTNETCTCQLRNCKWRVRFPWQSAISLKKLERSRCQAKLVQNWSSNF